MQRMFVWMRGNRRRGFEYAWQAPDPEPSEGAGLTWQQLRGELKP